MQNKPKQFRRVPLSKLERPSRRQDGLSRRRETALRFWEKLSLF